MLGLHLLPKNTLDTFCNILSHMSDENVISIEIKGFFLDYSIHIYNYNRFSFEHGIDLIIPPLLHSLEVRASFLEDYWN